LLRFLAFEASTLGSIEITHLMGTCRYFFVHVDICFCHDTLQIRIKTSQFAGGTVAKVQTVEKGAEVPMVGQTLQGNT
jgi:hypothetical protein